MQSCLDQGIKRQVLKKKNRRRITFDLRKTAQSLNLIQCFRMSVYLNTTRVLNGTELSANCSSPDSLSAEQIGKTFAYCLILIVSLTGNSFIGIIVYKTKTMRKTINFMIVNMAMSDLLFPIFALPVSLAELYADSWLIRGVPGEALCKLVYVLQDISTVVSVQSMVLITVDSWSSGIAHAFSAHQLKAMLRLYSGHVDRRVCRFYAIFIRLKTCWKPRRSDVRPAMERSVWWIVF